MIDDEAPLNILQHISSLLARNVDQILQEQLGIGYTQHKILEIIKDNPKSKQKFISFALGQTEAAISRQIKILLKNQLITSGHDPHSRRTHVINLTPKGLRITEASKAITRKYYSPILKPLHAKKQAQFIGILAEIDKKICNFDHDLKYLNYISAN